MPTRTTPSTPSSKEKHVFEPFEDLLRSVSSSHTGEWGAIEEEFLRVVEAFDAEYANGRRSKGWYQSKARYFNDIIVLLIGNRSRRRVASRCKRASQLFDMIDIDICFPSEGTPLIAAEVKALGTPPHPGNKESARPAKSDLHKRIREVAFTAMDLKAAYAEPSTIASLQEWVDKTSPGYFSFWAIRADNDADLESVRSTLTSLRAYCNGVGAVFYQPSAGAPTSYRLRPQRELSIDRCIREIAQRLTNDSTPS